MKKVTNKMFFVLLFIATVNLNSNLKSMEEQPATTEINQPKSLWSKLPTEVQQIVLSYVGLDKAESFGAVLDRLKHLEIDPSLSKVVNNKAFIISLAEKYINKHKDLASEEFLNAVQNNKKHVVKAFIGAGIDVNGKDKYGNTALMKAAMEGHKKIVKMLVNAGAQVNNKNGADYTALKFAIGGKYKDIVKILLEHDADLHDQDDWGITPLMEAILRKSDKEIVKMLIDAGADVNHRNKDSNTALIWAAANGNKDIVKMLIDAGADVNIVNKYGETALTRAKNRKNEEVVEMLKKLSALCWYAGQQKWSSTI